MTTTDASHQPASILIVDDERINIRVLHALLGNEFEIMVATDGEEALRVASAHRPDLILLDILMPGLDGHAVCRRLKQEPATNQIPVMFITAKSDAQDETLGFELGAVDYITKPFNFAVVAARVRTHVRLKRQNDLLEQLAHSDALTGIPNRRVFDETLAREWDRCRRNAAHLSLLMIDIDRFKLYNDHYGHGAGDNCLRQVASALASCARRPGDRMARYGGEEFAAVLADTDYNGALATAEQCLSAVRALGLPHVHSNTSGIVTASIGVATMVPHASSALHILSDAADQCLYMAKSGGRDRAIGVCL